MRREKGEREKMKKKEKRNRKDDNEKC